MGSNPSLSARWMFSAGAIVERSDAEVASFVQQSGIGGALDLSSLGIDEKHVSPFFALRYRSSSHWRWDLAYQNLRLDGQRGASTQINFGSISIPVGWNVATELSADLYSASVGYAFYRTPNAELGAMLGATVLDFSADVEGSFRAGNVVMRRSAGISKIVPVPILGLYGTYAFSDRLSVEGKVQYLAGSYADHSGSLFAVSAALNYWVMPNAALAVGYKHFDAHMKHDGESTRDTYDVQFGGPFATLSVGF